MTSNLAKAHAVQDYAVAKGFDWDEVQPVIDKVREELDEVQEAVDKNDAQHILEEVGDVLFCAVNLARKLGLDSDEALRLANTKFEKRFAQVEAYAVEAATPLEELSLEQMEKLWQKAKRTEHK